MRRDALAGAHLRNVSDTYAAEVLTRLVAVLRDVPLVWLCEVGARSTGVYFSKTRPPRCSKQRTHT